MGGNSSTQAICKSENASRTPNPSASYRLKFAYCHHPSDIVVTEDYIENWGSNDQDIIADITFKTAGLLNVSAAISNANDHATASIEVEIGGKLLRLDVKPEDHYETSTKLLVGSLVLNHPGFQTLRIRAQEDDPGAVGRLHFIELSGPATTDIEQYEITETTFLPATDIRLTWKTSTRGINMYYNEITVPECPAARFVACGFNRGYIGLVKGKVVFCIGSPWLEESNYLKYVPAYRKPKLVKNGYGGKVSHLNSNLDIECAFHYKWRPGELCRFLISAKSNDLKHTTCYSAYFFNNDTERWAYMATIKIYSMMKSFSELFMAIEKCQYFHGDNFYTMTCGPAWKHVKGKGWIQLNQAQFLPDKTSLPTEINAGVNENGSFFLATGGNTKSTAEREAVLQTRSSTELPEVLVDLDIDNQDDKDAWGGLSKYLIKAAP